MKNWQDEMIHEMVPNKQVSRKKSIGRKYQEEKVGRNEPCPCGSGRRYKKCCM